MKKLDYIRLAILIILIAFGIWLGHFWGGIITGACSVIALFTTLGKILYQKAQKRVDASIALARAMHQKNQ